MENRLGIVDWGIGGVSIYKLIKEKLGDIPITYFSDTGVTPYGKMSRLELVSRLNAVIAYLKSFGVTHLVIGCNAASTASSLLADHGIPIEGVIESAVETAAKAKPTRLGIIGGRRTVVSGVYRRAFAKLNIRVRQRIAQPLSALIESGDVSSQTLHDACEQILSPLRNCSHILLACTHYPAIVPVMKEFVSPKTAFIDPANGLVDRIESFGMTRGGRDVFLTTGEAADMQKAALAAFGVRLDNISKITL